MEEKDLNKKSEMALREEKILEFWRENNTFQKSLNKKSPKGNYVFYDGPVTANSKPVLHTMVPFSFKDVIPRYKTMQGYHVRRKGGWDTHGLPVELQIEKKLGFKSKSDIENYGITEFNKLCKDSVWEYIELWKNFTKRMGYWADQENPYVTYQNDYIESIWNIVKKVDEQKLLYKDYKVVPWCPRCGTALSSHELAQGYEDVKDLSVYVKFKVKGQENTYILAWTTTPWTLPGNVGLAVGEDIDYVKVKLNGEFLFITKSRISLITEKYEIVEELKGKDLVGLEYEPLFPDLRDYMQANEAKQKEFSNWKNGWKVYSADFVTTTDGTGVVHTAVMYGQDDFALGTKENMPKVHTVDLNGNFITGISPEFLAGRFVKETNVDGKPTLAVDIIDDLKKRNLFFAQENYKHNYPHCWRCKTALIYYARDSWYIRMSDPKIKSAMIEENKSINWEPNHIQEGRFGEWLREIKDWAISRERYWGTPLPVWECVSCKKFNIIGSIDELKKKTIKSGNKYFLMRHGESESNIKNNMHGMVSSLSSNKDGLTKKGRAQVLDSVENFKNQKIDLVYVSPFMRTRETLELIKNKLNIQDNQIILDDRLGELNAGDFEGKPWDEYRKMFKNERDRFLDPIHGGESLQGVKNRMGEVIYELEEKYKNQNILIISHGAPLWMLCSVAYGYNVDQTIAMTGGVFRVAEENDQIKSDFRLFKNAEIREISFVNIPHNQDYELDLHKPFIDSCNLVCDCGGGLNRTKEVMDVWFDSGAMPFAEDHYPFENKNLIETDGFPADYICEAIDQTRGWFYTLHAVGVLMGRGKACKNVICLGHLLDAKGKKMSKSIGNVVDPFEAIGKYGVDTLRMWMYSVNQPGESKNFDEKTVQLVQGQVFTLLYNVLAFYELYRDKELENAELKTSDNILDLWILSRLNELIKLNTENLNNYKLLEPARAIRDFIGDLSTWYLRRSRDRIKEGDVNAKQTMYFVLTNLAKLMAPFAPFTAEDIWLKLRNETGAESVHLAEWPKKPFKLFTFGKDTIIDDMQIVRDICTAGNAERQKINIPVRQPLGKIISKINVENKYIEIIKEELNIKEFVFDSSLDVPLRLDTNITGELKQEGDFRELLRALQDMRKKMGLTPDQVVNISLDTDQNGQELVKKFEKELKKTVLVNNVDFTENDGGEIKIDELVFKVKISKI
jgi:isoleucyl-tRNA synthetase